MDFITKVVTSKYSAPTFIWVAVSLVIAGVVAQLAFTETPTPFIDSLPFDGKVWSVALVLANVAAIIGMIRDTPRKWFIRTGSFASFCLWIFGTISFAESSGVLIPILSLPLMLVFAYIYLLSLVREHQV